VHLCFQLHEGGRLVVCEKLGAPHTALRQVLSPRRETRGAAVTGPYILAAADELLTLLSIFCQRFDTPPTLSSAFFGNTA
jgi:hypothetical protein